MARSPKSKEGTHDEATVDNDLPRYRVIEKSFIGHSMQEEGAEVTYEGEEVGDNLSPLNAAAQAVVDAQKAPHLDKTNGTKSKHPRRAADAASAGVGGTDGGEADELA